MPKRGARTQLHLILNAIPIYDPASLPPEAIHIYTYTRSCVSLKYFPMFRTPYTILLLSCHPLQNFLKTVKLFLEFVKSAKLTGPTVVRSNDHHIGRQNARQHRLRVRASRPIRLGQKNQGRPVFLATRFASRGNWLCGTTPPPRMFTNVPRYISFDAGYLSLQEVVDTRRLHIVFRVRGTERAVRFDISIRPWTSF
ncbi:hypothetical protein EVAR_42580_1 [Eumeta japonica]|uniref:Uncharacterized protein n=1 Tax=Eumeta variegata TaxID=151549 RepID=A0A4C1ZQ81_EUMVA|nr:hypothetical protein EVAR_42580_1 [Eumeta japonica]